MTILFVLIAVVVQVAVMYLCGQLLYRLAPRVGYVSETEREAWRKFGWNWGEGALIYWIVDLIACKLGRGSARKYGGTAGPT